jgi:hypothetical protein
MQCALIGLTANGYRPSTNVPGHHQTMIQTLTLTLGIPRDTWLVLDTLRRKRNLNDYSGDLMDAESVRECVAQAEAMFAKTGAWLAEHTPDLLKPTD